MPVDVDVAHLAPLVELPRRRLFGFALECPTVTGPNLACSVDVVARWRADAGPRVLVDADPADLMPTTLDDLLARAEARGVRTDALIVRIPHFEPSMHLPAIERLIEHGVQIAVRDVDLRGADLGILAGAPIDIMELPAALVAASDRDPAAAAALRARIELGHRHDWLALAWHVERAPQLEALIAVDCDLVAGPVAGRRLALAEADRAVARYLTGATA